ncbi:MAG TPA: MBL fold metallo-hydrolase [Solirubrobacteraceae bacterium]|jgi:L-ascorbate metabolism protein UlaG (beta-lactamase superfamily)|nr:MBL fold metallo-hydrolase [Solirubrobacteraceae bacterium]
MSTLMLRLVGGPTAVLEYGGLTWLTDPALSPPGEYAGGLVKTTGPAFEPDPVDVVLLSHDHHSDNLDPAGRDYLVGAGEVLTTQKGAERLGDEAVGLQPWETFAVGDVTVTAVPALHGPPGSEDVTGPVIGFVLAAGGAETVYISGDNASLDVVREVAERAGPIGIAVLFAGAVQIPSRFGGAYLTLSSDRAAEAARILGVHAAVPLHFEGWTHFTQGAGALRAAFAGNGVGDLLVLPERGETVAV